MPTGSIAAAQSGNVSARPIRRRGRRSGGLKASRLDRLTTTRALYSGRTAAAGRSLSKRASQTSTSSHALPVVGLTKRALGVEDPVALPLGHVDQLGP